MRSDIQHVKTEYAQTCTDVVELKEGMPNIVSALNEMWRQIRMGISSKILVNSINPVNKDNDEVEAEDQNLD
ncbi:hypothetical protein EPI10_006722 [Gossypium australe]|uniref:Uncharacterized protein n=1 Tax=Gossypium australe TaxID=47621 RepID=A0A5B6WRW7_9ROSI|nr:hypothetical protein EPI10_006722 [Gossypium australe]